ncbi:MAG: hypothetical protein ACI4JW_05845 [Oscillospiraceae bacterium]
MWTKATWTADEDTLEQRKEFAEKKPTVLTREQAEIRENGVDISGESGIIKSMGLGANNDGSLEKHDAPKLIKTIDPNDREAIRREFAEFEKTVVNESIEHALVVTKDGEVFHCYGVKDRVFVDYDLGDKLNGASVSHNHPISETEFSFSNNDLYLFYNYKLEELRGIDEKYEYRLSRTDLTIDPEPEDWQVTENSRHTNVILDVERVYNNEFGYTRRVRK